jgi:hypothetical protein
MTYHLARVAHWAQNRSLAHYPTHNVRQLYMAPGAELIILNLQLLVGADRLVNLPQWGALIGSAAAASLLAMRLGAGWRGQLAAAVVAATIPHGVASASGAQNDLVAAFWLLAAATLTWEYRRRPHWANAAAAGGAFGLGVLTKSTFFPYGLPFGLLLAAAAWQARGRRAWRPLLTAGLIAAALNAPWTIRNYAVFGHPLVDRQERGSYQNETHAPAALASVALRSAAMHLATPSEPINRAVYRAVAAVHRALGLELDDPRTTYLGTAFRPPEFSLHEDRATAPLHLLLALGCGAAALGARRARQAGDGDLRRAAVRVGRNVPRAPQVAAVAQQTPAVAGLQRAAGRGRVGALAAVDRRRRRADVGGGRDALSRDEPDPPAARRTEHLPHAAPGAVFCDSALPPSAVRGAGPLRDRASLRRRRPAVVEGHSRVPVVGPVGRGRATLSPGTCRGEESVGRRGRRRAGLRVLPSVRDVQRAGRRSALRGCRGRRLGGDHLLAGPVVTPALISTGRRNASSR